MLYLIPFYSCFFFKGYKQSLIIDTQRYRFLLVSNSIVDFVLECKKYTYKEMIKKYSSQKEMFQQYVKFLIKNEFCFFSNQPNQFNKTSITWDRPTKITNVIIDIKNPELNYKNVLKQVNELNTIAIQLRFYESFPKKDIVNILNKVLNVDHKNLSIIISYNSILENKRINEILTYGKTISELIIYNSDEKEIINSFEINIDYRKGNIDFEKECGTISKKHFSPNFEAISESYNFNSCLNRKISIDKNGYIKNCPSMKHHYGHISSTKLEDVVDLPEFQKWWHIKKDDIDVCKDCEFRHICSDCRAFIKDSSNILSHPAKCTYNPYIAKWKGEKDYYPIKKCVKL